MFKLLTRLAPLAVALGWIVAQAAPAYACGGLVAPDGDVRLARASTLVAWHDGVERYLTSFAYQGNESDVGWIVPLPAVPLKIEPGGRWTLQRLERETHPIVFEDAGAFPAAASAAPAQVLQQVQIEALTITVLKGSGQAVLDWCATNGFVVAGETRAHLLIYARGSPIFMAAKYDTAAARARGQQEGDGAPVLITMRTAHPWVPLEVLALDGQQVQADLYLLTDEPLNTRPLNAVVGQSAVGSQIPGAPGFEVAFQEPMNATLYHDLSTDRNMAWVRPDGWLTYLSLDAPAEQVTYDLGVTSGGIIRVVPFGTPPMQAGEDSGAGKALDTAPHLPMGTPQTALAVGLALLLCGAAFGVARMRARLHPKG